MWKTAVLSKEDHKYLSALDDCPYGDINYVLPSKIDRRFIRVGWVERNGDGYLLTKKGKAILRKSNFEG